MERGRFRHAETAPCAIPFTPLAGIWVTYWYSTETWKVPA